MLFRSQIPAAAPPPFKPLGKIAYSDKGNEIGLAVALITLPLACLAWHLPWDARLLVKIFDRPIWLILGMLLGILIVHEWAHLIAHPRMGFSRNSITGYDRKRSVFFAYYRGPISKSRYIYIVLMPLILLSVVPYALAFIWPQYVKELAFCSIANMIGAGYDLYLATSVMLRVPAGCVISDSDYGFLDQES